MVLFGLHKHFTLWISTLVSSDVSSHTVRSSLLQKDLLARALGAVASRDRSGSTPSTSRMLIKRFNDLLNIRLHLNQ